MEPSNYSMFASALNDFQPWAVVFNRILTIDVNNFPKKYQLNIIMLLKICDDQTFFRFVATEKTFETRLGPFGGSL